MENKRDYEVWSPDKRVIPFSRRLKILLIEATKSMVAIIIVAIITAVTILIGSLIFACFYGGN